MTKSIYFDVPAGNLIGGEQSIVNYWFSYTMASSSGQFDNVCNNLFRTKDPNV